MKFGSITSRRCRRCGAVSNAQLPDTDTHRNLNTHRLCDKCTKWQKGNQKRAVK